MLLSLPVSPKGIRTSESAAIVGEGSFLLLTSWVLQLGLYKLEGQKTDNQKKTEVVLT